jgi:DNA-directed RNA polymerase I, II, and III subunit RPABC2
LNEIILKITLVNITMSDYENSSSDSENDDESVASFVGESSSTSKAKPAGRGTTIEQYEDDDAEEEEQEENDDDDDDVKEGGADSDIEEGEIQEGDSDEDEEEEDEEEGEEGEEKDLETNNLVKEKKVIKPKASKKPIQVPLDSDDEEDDDIEENYLQKFDHELTKNYISDYHPECFVHNYEEVGSLSKVVRNSENIIVDPLHKTIPFLTKYEKARVLGQRAKQIESGSKPFVRVPENVVDGYVIAELELNQKRIPFIIRRPLPNGGCEYWNLKDLEMINF